MHNLLDFDKQDLSQSSLEWTKGTPQNQEHHTQKQEQEQNLENREPNLQPQLSFTQRNPSEANNIPQNEIKNKTQNGATLNLWTRPEKTAKP